MLCQTCRFAWKLLGVERPVIFLVKCRLHLRGPSLPSWLLVLTIVSGYTVTGAQDVCIRVLPSWVEPPRGVPSLRILPLLDTGLVVFGRSSTLYPLLMIIDVDCCSCRSRFDTNRKLTTDSSQSQLLSRRNSFAHN
jgi:hypothetical protein